MLPIVVDRATPRPAVRRSWPRDPDAELTVDLAEQGVLLPDGTTIDFDIDPFAKRMILAGTDELGYLLSKEPELDGLGGRPPAADRLARRSALTGRRRRRGSFSRGAATTSGCRSAVSGRAANAHRAADERRRQVIAVGLDGGVGQAERADRRVGGEDESSGVSPNAVRDA